MLAVKRRLQEFSLIGRDPVLALSLIISALFLFAFIVFPIAQTVWSGFFNKEGQFSLTYFARYFDSYYGPVSRQIFLDTLTMGVLTAAGAHFWGSSLHTPSSGAGYRGKTSSTFWPSFPPSLLPLPSPLARSFFSGETDW